MEDNKLATEDEKQFILSVLDIDPDEFDKLYQEALQDEPDLLEHDFLIDVSILFVLKSMSQETGIPVSDLIDLLPDESPTVRFSSNSDGSINIDLDFPDQVDQTADDGEVQ